jgi:EAL domain-containing protein (putative c-di-GMP-specific phosphodiesterase class I)
MKVVAEGVEKREQMQFIRSLKCDELQGNIFSLPLPPEEIGKLLKKEKSPNYKNFSKKSQITRHFVHH